MPRVKKTSVADKEKKTEKKSKKIIKTVKPVKTNNPVIKKTPLKKKALPVIIDVIEDDEPEEKEAFFPELPEAKAEEIISQPFKEIGRQVTDIDQQKKFFSEMVNEIKDKNPKTKNKVDDNSQGDEPVTKKSVSLYRRLVWRFIALTIVLLVVVFYFSFSKLTIILSPTGETINDNILLKISPANASLTATSTDATSTDTDFREAVSGDTKEIIVSGEKTFTASGEEFTGDEITGTVQIINNSNKNQTLVATTRILSPDSKLFRIQNAVTIPAGGEVSVNIYADKPSADLAISPTTFTIPGLWAGLQNTIYAKSTEAFVYQQKVKKYVNASDIEQATNEMNNILLAQAKQNESSLGQDEESLYETLNPANFSVSANAGDAKDTFTVKASGTMVMATFSKTEVAKLTTAKLDLLVPDDKQLVDYNPDNITYTFDSYDDKTGIATIKASFSGTMILKNDTEIIDKKQLVNLNKQQLENYLKTFPEIKSYEFQFFPSFITRAPRLPERISIVIKGLEK
jgi:hypothetical protein